MYTVFHRTNLDILNRLCSMIVVFDAVKCSGEVHMMLLNEMP